MLLTLLTKSKLDFIIKIYLFIKLLLKLIKYIIPTLLFNNNFFITLIFDLSNIFAIEYDGINSSIISLIFISIISMNFLSSICIFDKISDIKYISLFISSSNDIIIL